MGRLQKQPVQLVKDVAESGKVYWHLSDSRLATVFPFLDYVIYLSDFKNANPKTVEGSVYSLKKWYQFLSDENIDHFEVDDSVIDCFKEHLSQRDSHNSGSDRRARMRTINLDLRVVYSYYAWLQQHCEYGKGRSLLGAHSCQVTESHPVF